MDNLNIKTPSLAAPTIITRNIIFEEIKEKT